MSASSRIASIVSRSWAPRLGTRRSFVRVSSSLFWYSSSSVSEQYQQISGSSASEIALSVQAAVADGRLAPGAALPSVRRLATDLEVSPTTVAAALADLRRRGVVVSRPRSGTRVAERPPLRPVRAAAGGARGRARPRERQPRPALLPPLAPALRALEAPQRLYGGEPLLPELAEVAGAAFAADGVPAARLCAVNGALDGIERVLAAHLQPGDAVAVEDPGWPGVLDVARMLGLRLVPVAVDARGMLPDALAAAQRAGARAVVLTPRGHNPCGAALDAERARELRAVLAEDVLVVEDDHLGPVAGTPWHTLADGRRHWATVRSRLQVARPRPAARDRGAATTPRSPASRAASRSAPAGSAASSSG